MLWVHLIVSYGNLINLILVIVHPPLFFIARQPVFNTIAPVDLGLMNIECIHCDALHWSDEHVSSSRIGRPEFQMCCAHGKVKLSPL
jgi:hypothetical protein